jgi:hypothetical protein
MGQSISAACRYEIDAADRISAVSEPWLAFARENDAPRLTRDAVVGRPLWDFIAGEETRELYRAVLRRVRDEDVSIVLPFRCDSPDFRRWMRLVMTPREMGRVCFDGILVRKRERLHLGIIDPHAPRLPEPLPMCSCCKRVLLESRWLEPEDAMVRFHALGAEPYPSLRQVVCDACRSYAEHATAIATG